LLWTDKMATIRLQKKKETRTFRIELLSDLNWALQT
jgi:hypothetical protein